MKKSLKNKNKSIIDQPFRPNLRIKDGKFYSIPLKTPLKPTPYVPPKPVPKPRTKGQVPIPLPRRQVPKVVSERVKTIRKLIDEIAPFYAKEAIDLFKKGLKFISKAEIIEKTKALKNNARSFEVTIINNRDPSIQLADTKKVLEEKFRELLDKRGGYKFNITLKVKLSKETGDGKIYKEPYCTSSTMTVLNNNEIGSQIDLAIEKILEGIAVWLSEGSGWKIEKI